MVELNLVTESELEQAIATEFSPTYIGFHSEKTTPDDIAVDGVLNFGVNPR